MEQTFIQQILQGGQIFLQNINWLFTFIFVILMWLFNEGTDSNTSFSWLDWLRKIPKGWRTFVGGILLSIPFAWFYNLEAKADYASLLYSILIGMVIWKLGINSVFDWFKRKVWSPNDNTPK